VSKSTKTKGFVLDVAPLANGIHILSFELSPSNIGLEDTDFEQITVEISLDRQVDKALVQISTKALAHLVCDRTLVPFTQWVEGEHEVFFDDEITEGAENDEVRPFPLTQKLELTDDVRDTILLSVPIRKIAPEALEADIPLAFGAVEEEDHTDARWDALKALKFGSEN
jgi:uncharacterized protein